MSTPARARRRRRALAGAAAAAILALSASSALGAISFYKTGSLASGVTYSSVQRSDWYATSINNESSTNMNGRVWAYNVLTSTYVMQLPFATFPPGTAYGTSYPRQASVRNYCLKNNGGTQAGSCSAAY